MKIRILILTGGVNYGEPSRRPWIEVKCVQVREIIFSIQFHFKTFYSEGLLLPKGHYSEKFIPKGRYSKIRNNYPSRKKKWNNDPSGYKKKTNRNNDPSE